MKYAELFIDFKQDKKNGRSREGAPVLVIGFSLNESFRGARKGDR